MLDLLGLNFVRIVGPAESILQFLQIGIEMGLTWIKQNRCAMHQFY